MMIHYLICMGSNTEPSHHMALARCELQRLFTDVSFTPELTTEPLGMKHSTAPFVNQLARFTSQASPSEVQQLLKQIEHTAGRRPEEKALEIIRLDLDLLMADGHPLRKEELQRSFVKQLLTQF